ncbi:MAG: hypothetical protein ACTSPG_06790 [Candidatus Hodarchaeales archaeon]
MLDELLITQGITTRGRFSLLCFPDYLFFRNHPHKLYREFTGFPRYSIFSRKFTDQNYEDNSCNTDFSLKSLYVIDGNTALTNVRFFFPLTKCFNFSVVGTNLDFTEIGRIRYSSLPNSKFYPFKPHTISLDSQNDIMDLDDKASHDSKSFSLPLSYELRLSDDTESKNNTIIIGSVTEISDFFPPQFDILRLNLGDLVE